MKVCNKCNIEKENSEFYNKHSRCKECTKNHYKENKEKILEQTNKYYHSNIDIAREKRKKYYHENQDTLRPKMNKWKEENRELLRIKNKEWYEENKDTISQIRKRKYKENWKGKRDKMNAYKKNRLSTDILFKIKNNISSLIRVSLKSKGVKKSSKTSQILGCSIEDFKLYLESKFEHWMNWDNHGKYNGELEFGWDIDHIIPVSSGKNEIEVIRLNHYKNLQPLCSKTNRDIKRSIY